MTSPRAPVIGLPTLRLSSWASSSLCSLIRAANLDRIRPRLPAAQVAQPLRSSNAACAAATARSTSSRPPIGAVAMTAPVTGLTTSNVCPSAASTDWPPMTISRGRRRVGGAGRGWRLDRHLSGPREAASGVGVGGRYARARCRWRWRRPAGSRRRRPAGRSPSGPRGHALLDRDDRGADDPRVVAQGGGHDRRPDREPRDEPVGVLAHAAAEDQEVRPEQRVDAPGGARRGRPPRPSTTGRAASGRRRRIAARRPAADLHLAELGVRDQDAVVEDAGPDAGPERQEDDRPGPVLAHPEAHLGDPRGVGVVHDRDRAEQRPREALDDSGSRASPGRCSTPSAACPSIVTPGRPTPTGVVGPSPVAVTSRFTSRAIEALTASGVEGTGVGTRSRSERIARPRHRRRPP